MARGNNGNLLQHAIECELGSLLFRAGGEKGLHLVVTHGMGPTEPFETRTANPGACLMLDRWLEHSQQQALLPGSPMVLGAYQSCKASDQAYPNTGELLTTIIEQDKLRGSISEIDPAKVSSLEQRWRSTDIKVLPGSWRGHLHDYRCPKGLNVPWLFTMDPMTYTRSPVEDDNKLRISDLRSLVSIFQSYFSSKQPGAVCLFCFSMQPGIRETYKVEVQAELVEKLPSVLVHFFETTARGGNKHVGAVLSLEHEMIQKVDEAWSSLIN